MPHLHLSLQAGDDLILKRMKRRHLPRRAIAPAPRARALRPDIVVRRRPDRRLSDRDRGDVRRNARPGRGMRPHLPARLSLSARGPARRRRGCRRCRCRCVSERAARLRAAGEAALRPRFLERRQVGRARRPPRSIETRRAMRRATREQFAAGAARLPAPGRRRGRARHRRSTLTVTGGRTGRRRSLGRRRRARDGRRARAGFARLQGRACRAARRKLTEGITTIFAQAPARRGGAGRTRGAADRRPTSGPRRAARWSRQLRQATASARRSRAEEVRDALAEEVAAMLRAGGASRCASTRRTAAGGAGRRRQRHRQDHDDRQAGQAAIATQGSKVVLAAGDTFRAAAVEQLQIWGERTGVPVIAGRPAPMRPGSPSTRWSRRAARGRRRAADRHRRPAAQQGRR